MGWQIKLLIKLHLKKLTTIGRNRIFTFLKYFSLLLWTYFKNNEQNASKRWPFIVTKPAKGINQITPPRPPLFNCLFFKLNEKCCWHEMILLWMLNFKAEQPITMSLNFRFCVINWSHCESLLPWKCFSCFYGASLQYELLDPDCNDEASAVYV